MTDLDPLAEIRQRRAAATPGPWQVRDEIGEKWRSSRPATEETAQWYWDVWADEAESIVQTEGGEGGVILRTDAEFIAHAPTDIDTLIAQVERLRGLLREIEFACSGWEGQRYCPACESGDHQPDCKLAAELRST